MTNLEKFQSHVVVTNHFPTDRIDRDQSFLLYDQNLLKQGLLQEVIKSFPNRLGLEAGEALKDFKIFPKNFDKVMKNWPQPISRQHQLVVLGGGSLGDFGGFLASVLKRGVVLHHIPTTWLAAMDSAHGGKNGLNHGGIKNQIGTFYPAQNVFIVRDILESVPDEIKAQSFGELVKMGLIGESQFFKELMLEKRSALDFMWRFLPSCIEDKYQVVLQDPYETKKMRQVLNFGHTLGHALEAHFGWAHGDAVLQGVYFALEWSVQRDLLPQSLQQQILDTLSSHFDRAPAVGFQWYKKMSERHLVKALTADKKSNADGQILFVFIKNIGQPILDWVSIEDIVNEAKRQNWVK